MALRRSRPVDVIFVSRSADFTVSFNKIINYKKKWEIGVKMRLFV